MLYIPIYMVICIYIYKHSNEYKLVFVKQQIKIAFFLYLPYFFFIFSFKKVQLLVESWSLLSSTLIYKYGYVYIQVCLFTFYI